MLVISLPFIWVGVALTMRRLRAIGLPPWLVVFFFAPYLNLLFFVLLCIYPSQEGGELPAPRRVRRNRTLELIIPESAVGSAAVALLLTSLLGAAATILSVTVFAVYGWGLFVALPFCLGLFAVLLYGYHQPRSLGSCILVACLTVILLGAVLIALAFEGAICLLMALPVAGPLAVMGGSVGFCIQRRQWDRLETQATFSALLLFVPFLMATESLNPKQPPLQEVRTQLEINASPARVWRYLVSFPTLPPPAEWPFQAGIAYPIRSSLRGWGPSAQRECTFSSGQFVEPIQIWDENRRLKFTVSAEPPVMEEFSPYGRIHTRHIDEKYFQPQDAEFVLEPLPGGRTLLIGASRYRNRMWPAAYWSLWSDAILHQIHLRVFRHIKRLAEEPELQAAKE